MRDEETALSNPTETDGGLRRKAGWAAGAVGLGARRPQFLSVEGLVAGLLGRRRGKGPDFLAFKPLRLRGWAQASFSKASLPHPFLGCPG